MFKALFATSVVALLAPALVFCAPISPCDATAGHLLTNCGFEAGDFSGWTQSGNLDSTFVLSNFDGFLPNSGSFAAMGPAGTDGLLTSQTIATIPGAFYIIAWYLASDSGTPDDFNVTWDGNTISSQSDLAVPDWVLYSFTEVATTASTRFLGGWRSAPNVQVLSAA